MSNSNKNPPAALEGQLLSPTIPLEIREVLGEPVRHPHEDPDYHDKLMAWLSRDLKPKDAIEWIWLTDVVEAVREEHFLKRFHMETLKAGQYDAMKEALVIFYELQGRTPADALKEATIETAGFVAQWDEPGILAQLASVGITRDALFTRGRVLRAAELAVLERRLDQAGARRNRIVREQMHRREAQARLRRLMDSFLAAEVVDA